MFFYINPGFRNKFGHHLAHQSAIWNSYRDEFCVVAHRELEVDNLPYKIIKAFKYNTWQYLENPDLLSDFVRVLKSMENEIDDNDILFMYMSDVLFIYPFIEFLKRKRDRPKVILNLFHSGKYFFTNTGLISGVRRLLLSSKQTRKVLGILLTVEGIDIQKRIQRETGEKLPVLPMLHVDAEVFKKYSVVKRNKGKKIISYVSASVERGLYQYINLLKYIDTNNPSLFEKYEFRVRYYFENPVYEKLIKNVHLNIAIGSGRLSEADYVKFIQESDVLLLPYLPYNFFGRTSGVFYEAILNDIPVVASVNTWNGYYTEKLGIGETFNVDNTKAFYDKLINVLNNNVIHKENLKKTKKAWIEYHSIINFNKMINKMAKGKPWLPDYNDAYHSIEKEHAFFKLILSDNKGNAEFEEDIFISLFTFSSEDEGIMTFMDLGCSNPSVPFYYSDIGWKVIALDLEGKDQSIFLTEQRLNSDFIYIPVENFEKWNDLDFINRIVSKNDLSLSSKKNEIIKINILEDVIKKYKIEHLNYIKIDTWLDGLNILKNIKWRILVPEVVMVRFNNDYWKQGFNYTHHDVVNYMQDKGYNCFVSEREGSDVEGLDGKEKSDKWVRCRKYSSEREVNYGYLIFVLPNSEKKLTQTLRRYLKRINKHNKKGILLRMKILAKNILSDGN